PPQSRVFRFVLCVPAEGPPGLPSAEILTYEEIARLTRVAASIGIEQVRLTGGEPLVRRDVPELVRMLHDIPGLRSLSLTTNGVLLTKLAGPLAEAGLTRINVSLDSLERERFAPRSPGATLGRGCWLEWRTQRSPKAPGRSRSMPSRCVASPRWGCPTPRGPPAASPMSSAGSNSCR